MTEPDRDAAEALARPRTSTRDHAALRAQLETWLALQLPAGA